MNKKIIFILAILSVVFLLNAWDDEEIFKGENKRDKPNVVMIMDNSNSMSEIVYFPKKGFDGVEGTDDDGYDSEANYSGTVNNYYYSSGTGSGVFTDIPGYGGAYQYLTQTNWYGFVRVPSTNTAYFADRSYMYGGTVVAGTIEVPWEVYDLYNDVSVSNNGWIGGKTSGAYAQVTARSSSYPKYYITVANVTGAFTAKEVISFYRYRSGGAFFPIYLYGDSDDADLDRKSGDYPWYDRNYVKWMTLKATVDQVAAISHFSRYGTFDIAQFPSPDNYNLNPSHCNCPGYKFVKKVFTRIQVAREVSCKLLDDNTNNIRFALYNFNSNSEGANCLDVINDTSESNNDLLKKKIFPIYGSTGTPLAEALADVWRDFKPGSSAKNYWPVQDGYQSDPGSQNGNSDYMTSGCQGNYVIMVTDGQSSSDTFGHHTTSNSIFAPGNWTTYPIKRTGTYQIGVPWDYKNGWGDADATYDQNPGPASAPRPYCPYQTCWISDASQKGNDWLDDVAYFLFNQDMYPDKYEYTEKKIDEVGTPWRGVWNSDQNIRTFTVGLNTDNDMLERTAKNGGGKYKTAANFEELTAAIQQIINNIYVLEQEMMFTTFAAPKQSVTHEKFGYIATFIPRNGKRVWQGQLKKYQLDDNGIFPSAMVPLWDAGRILAERSADDRIIYTVKGGALVDFNNTNITAADLGVVVKDDPLTPEIESDVLRDKVINFIRGNNGYTDAYEADDGDPNTPEPPNGYKLGDIFHFNPLVVSPPLQWKAAFDPSYKTFYDQYSNRMEMLYVGANDGMMHAFKITDGSELWAFIPPSHLNKLKYLALEETDLAEIGVARPYYHRYFIDGKGLIKDVKVGGDWKTLFIFGMGIGGKTYCALDITQPDPSVTDGGPQFLWELNDALMGCTEARPIIAEINDGSVDAPLSAVFLPGGVACSLSDVTKPVWSEKPATLLQQGQALFTLNAYTGERIHTLKYGTTEGWSSVNKSYSKPSLLYQIAAPSSLLDKNNDGVADYAYFMETGSYQTKDNYGGQLWRMNVLGSPSSWRPEKIYKADVTQTLYLGATLGFDMENHLWVMFGSGRRPDITAISDKGVFLNPGGQLITLRDDFSVPTVPYTNTANLVNIKSWFLTPTAATPVVLSSTVKGVYFNYKDVSLKSNEVFYEPMPIYVDNWVYSNSFVPQTPTSTNISRCGNPPISGLHNVYKFRISASGNSITFPGALTTTGRILGFGLLSSGEYNIYFGTGAPGGFSIFKTEKVALADIFGPVVWKEVKK